ncbi:hypothetical protein DS878_01825 [Marinobacter sp. F3R11]|nr:hypothetical protein DS878_01825 [Marinobacter sp. F3R11]
MNRNAKLFIYRVGGLSLLYIVVILLGRAYFPDKLGVVLAVIIVGVLTFAAVEEKYKRKRKK